MEEKDTFTLRLPTEKNKSIRKLADDIGISQNSLILLFVDYGLKSFDEAIPHQLNEFYHWLSQNQK